jgi:hypothetical protein
VYHPADGAWTDLSAPLSGSPPSPRSGHGFTSASEGKLYVHGGEGNSGEIEAGRADVVGMVGAEAGRRDVLPRDRRRGGQAGMEQLGWRDGRRAEEGAPTHPPVDWCGGGLGRRGRLSDLWPPLCHMHGTPKCVLKRAHNSTLAYTHTQHPTAQMDGWPERIGANKPPFPPTFPTPKAERLGHRPAVHVCARASSSRPNPINISSSQPQSRILSSLEAGWCARSPCRYSHPSIHPP